MAWRKWFVRSLVFSIIGAFCSVGLLYYRWTDPAKVRELVIAKLEGMYPGAVITVDSAHLRILGGIQVNELRMSRRDDPDRTEFFHVPSAIIYHDKEKILDGMITLRKVELHRARLRAVLQRNGKWNLEGIISERPSNVQLPTVVWHHGTIVLEDQRAPHSATPIELEDVDLSFINDPVNVVTMHGSAHSPVLGALALGGTVKRKEKEVSLKATTRGARVDTALLQRLPLTCPSLENLVLEARADLDASLDCRFDHGDALDYRIHVDIADGKLRHPHLPLALDHVQARLECINGTIQISDFQARSQQTLLTGHATAQLPCPDQTFEAELELRHLMVDAKLTERLPKAVHHLQQLFQATGPTTLKIACARRDGEWVNLSNGKSSQVTMLPEDLRVCFKYFPFPLEKLTGSVEYYPQTHATLVREVVGYASDCPIQLNGFWQGTDERTRASFDIDTAGDLIVEPKLIDALPVNLRRLTNSFHPTGKISAKARLKREAGSTEFRNEYHLALREGTVRWNDFPYPLEKVSGLLDIYPEYWEFQKGYGRHQGGEIQIQGRSLRGDPARRIDDGMALELAGRAIPLDADMRQALSPMPQLAKSWDTFRPRGRIKFNANVQSPPGRPQDLAVLVDVDGAGVEPVFFPYLISDISGRFSFHNNLLEARRIRARHDDTRLAMDHGTVDLLPGGGHFTWLRDLRVQRLRAEPALLQALPKALRSFASTLQLTSPVDIKTMLKIRQDSDQNSLPDIGWDGTMTVKNTDLAAGVSWNNVNGAVACRGRYDGYALRGLKGNFVLDRADSFKQRFKKAYGVFEVKENFPDILLLGVRAPIFGGDLTGQARIEMTSAMRYEVNMYASHIDLKQFGAHNLGERSELNGRMEARLHLWGLGSDANTLDGNGTVDVDHGQLYNLPLLLDLIKFLGLRLPDRTAFEQMHARYSVHGKRATVQQLELIGNAISLSGKGSFNLDGTNLNLDFRPSFGHVESWLDGVFKPVSSLISKNILIIEVRGNVDGNPDHLKFNKKFVPIVSDQLRDLRQRMGPEK